MAIHFFSEQIAFQLPNKQKRKIWLGQLAKEDGFSLKELNYIFCTDEYLYQLNLDYLQHTTYTDTITFDSSEKEMELEGDIFISIERVKENALVHQTLFENELSRVMAHGALHLMGYKDKYKEEVALMRKKEEEAITLYQNLKTFHVKP
ncbi:MAG: rRNA maturation RNase YbeY [Algoriphagus sp.]